MSQSQSMFQWLNRRQLGFGKTFGTTDNIYRSLYSHINPQKKNLYDYGGIFGLEFSPDSSILIAACEKRSLIIFDTLSQRPIKVLDNVHEDCVNCVKFLDDRMFATCSDDATVALYDTRNLKKKVRTLRGHSNWVKNIEYSKKDGLLVTSGFDGSIFTWDLNSYTESSLTYQKVFHMPGLMRCRLSPDDRKLVISTTGGYLILINDLDLNTLARDLAGFRPDSYARLLGFPEFRTLNPKTDSLILSAVKKLLQPNLYRLMQVRQQYLPIAGKYDQLFSKHQKTNRVELVSDFPKGNDAEVISSLQIHPQGWCALSRNNSYDESSEWTCVHDIQDIDSEDEDIIPDFPLQNDFGLTIPEENIETHAQAITQSVPSSRYSSSNSSSSGSSNSSSTSTNESVDRPVRVVNPPARRRRNPNIQIQPPSDNEQVPSNNEDIEGDLWTGNVPFSQRTRRQLHERPLRINTGVITVTRPYNVRRQPSIKQNKNRMLHYSQETNKGKGFIKELCFSSDGRIICSPYGNGIRLLGFSNDCQELPYALPTDDVPQRLSEIQTNMEMHSDIVVSTKFCPRAPIVVSGCLRGELVWYSPQ